MVDRVVMPSKPIWEDPNIWALPPWSERLVPRRDYSTTSLLRDVHVPEREKPPPIRPTRPHRPRTGRPAMKAERTVPRVVRLNRFGSGVSEKCTTSLLTRAASSTPTSETSSGVSLPNVDLNCENSTSSGETLPNWGIHFQQAEEESGIFPGVILAFPLFLHGLGVSNGLLPVEKQLLQTREVSSEVCLPLTHSKENSWSKPLRRNLFSRTQHLQSVLRAKTSVHASLILSIPVAEIRGLSTIGESVLSRDAPHVQDLILFQDAESLLFVQWLLRARSPTGVARRLCTLITLGGQSHGRGDNIGLVTALDAALSVPVAMTTAWSEVRLKYPRYWRLAKILSFISDSLTRAALGCRTRHCNCLPSVQMIASTVRLQGDIAGEMLMEKGQAYARRLLGRDEPNPIWSKTLISAGLRQGGGNKSLSTWPTWSLLQRAKVLRRRCSANSDTIDYLHR